MDKSDRLRQSIVGQTWGDGRGSWLEAAGGKRWRHWHACVLASEIIAVPAMGDSVTEGTIASVLKAPGGVSSDWGAAGKLV